MTEIAGTLPYRVYEAAGVFDGTHAYLFGGWGPDGRYDTIVRYDPATGASEVLPARLPYPLSWTEAVLLDGVAYIPGGCCAGQNVLLLGTTDLARLTTLRVDLASGIVTRLPALLPYEVYGHSVGTDGEHLYVFGGFGRSDPLPRPNVLAAPYVYHDEILRIDPTTGLALVLEDTLPTELVVASVAWTGDHFLVTGGFNGDSATWAAAARRVLVYEP